MPIQPYRLPSATCLDPPRFACALSPPSRSRVAAAIAVLLGFGCFAGVAGAAARIEKRGQIEIAPGALVHGTKKPSHPHPKPAATAPHGRRLAVKPWLRASHDPDELVDHARRLQQLDMDVTIIDVDLPPQASTNVTLKLLPASWLPVFEDGHPEGLELNGIRSDSPLRLAGVEDGDQLLGVDGYLFDDNTFPNLDMAAIQRHRRVIVEVARGEHHVVLSIGWHATR